MYDGSGDNTHDGGGMELPPAVADGVKQLALGAKLYDLAADQAEWSQKTFGADAERGPIGALRHLAKEAVEAVEAYEAVERAVAVHDPHTEMLALKFGEELADCLLLLLDASRRGDVSPVDLVIAAQAKMKVNRTRVYQKTPDGVPSEHVRETDGRFAALGVAAEVVFRAVGGWCQRNAVLLYLIGGLAYLAGVTVWLLNK